MRHVAPFFMGSKVLPPQHFDFGTVEERHHIKRLKNGAKPSNIRMRVRAAVTSREIGRGQGKGEELT